MHTLLPLNHSLPQMLFSKMTNRVLLFNKFLFSKWIACRLVSDHMSVRYGLRFSYPISILFVTFGILTQSQFVLIFTAIIAFLGIILPLHPFDYVYNYAIATGFGKEKIPGRGSELQVSSSISVLFHLIVLGLLVGNVPINYLLLASIYLMSSSFFIVVLLRKNSL